MRHRLLLAAYRLARYHAWAVLIAFLSLAILGLLYLRDLPINSALKELIPQNDPVVERIEEQQKLLEETEEITVLLRLISPPATDRERIDRLIGAAEQLQAALAGNDEFLWVRYRLDVANQSILPFDLSFLEEGVAYLSSETARLSRIASETPDLAVELGELSKIYSQTQTAIEQLLSGWAPFSPEAREILRNLAENLQRLKNLNQGVYTALEQLPAQLDRAHQDIAKVREFLQQLQPQQRVISAETGLRLSHDKSAMLVSMRPRLASHEGVDYNRRILRMVDEAIASINPADLGIETGKIGPYVFSAESDDAIHKDISLTTLITIIGVLLLFMVVLRRFFYPLLATFPVLIALIFTVALTKLVFGGLNLITAFLPAIVLGLGIDYGIQFITHYLEERQGTRRIAPALRATLTTKGSAMISAAAAASAVMLALGIIAKSVGLSEIGYILAMGVIFSCLMTLVLLPALIVAINTVLGRRLRAKPPKTWNVTWAAGAIVKARWVILALTIAGSVAMFFPAREIRFSFVDEALQPNNLAGNKVREWIVQNFEQGPSTGNVFAFFVTEAEARRVTEQLVKLESVENVEGYYKSVVPPEEKLDQIKNWLTEMGRLDPIEPLTAIKKNLEYLDAQLKDSPAIRASLASLEDELSEGQQQIENSTGEEELASQFASLRDSTGRIRVKLGELDSANSAVALGETLFDFNDLLQRLTKLRRDIPTSEQIDDFIANPPQEIQDMFFFRDPQTGERKQRIFVWLKLDWLWDSVKYAQFVREASGIWPDFLGLPMLRAQLETYMKADFTNSTGAAVIIILILLGLDFRGTRLRGATIFSIITLGLGYLWLIGVMVMRGIDFNVASVLISPLLLGLGVDNCVYLLHRFQNFRSKKNGLSGAVDGRKLIEQATASTAIPILANTMAAVIAFGSLMIAETPILRILGESAVIGLGFMALFSLTFLPSIFSVRR